MPQSTGAPPHRRTRRPWLRRAPRPRPTYADPLDPVCTRVPKPFLTPGNVVLLVGMTVFGLYATGHLQELDHLFDQLHAFGRAHNDTVVHGLIYGGPVALVVFALAGLVTVRSLAAEIRYQAVAPAVQVAEPSAKRSVRRSAAAVRAARHSASRLITRSFRKPPARSGRDFPPREVCRTPRDSVASLPCQPPPRPASLRRDPHSPLPPAVAAALKEHLAASSLQAQ